MNQPDTATCEDSGVAPNQPKTPARAFRPPPDVWDKVVARAAAMGVTYTDVLIEALEAYFAHAMDEPIVTVWGDLTEDQRAALFDRVADAAHALDEQVTCGGVGSVRKG